MMYPLTFLLIYLPTLILAQSLYPAALPVAVRSPYLNGYISSQAGNNILNQWPTYWDQSRILGWAGYIRVDGSAHKIWGGSGTAGNFTSLQITPTSTTINLVAGPMDVSVTFFSPIEPTNLALQSLPFSYVYANATSRDGASHEVQFYSDISCEWVSGNSDNLVRWNTIETATVMYHSCVRQSPEIAREIANMVEDGTVFYGMLKSDSSTYRTGNDTVVRASFETDGKLDNSADSIFRAINQNYVVLAHATDLGTISQTDSPVVWAIGYIRDPAIIMSTPSGNQTRSSYFFSEYNTVEAAMNFFLGDFSDAQQRASDIDNQLLSDANAISSEYADLVSLAARQALALDITVSKSNDGTFNTSDVMTFMRDVGQSRRSNPVEMIYAAFPTYLYFNASWAGHLLAPLLQYQASDQYSRSYAGPDLGASYPYINGNSDPDIFGALENSGNMLIMAWAHARFTGDGSMLNRYYGKLSSFANYMLNSPVKFSGYSDADGLDNVNMTNLAIKVILGVKAMSEISASTGNTADAKKYSDAADSSYATWKSLAASQGHLVSTYNDLSSWSLVYNLFADKLLGTNLVEDSIFSQQDTFYASQAEIAGNFGLQFDSSVAETAKSHWTMFAAASCSDTSVRDTLISFVHSKAASNASAGVFPTTYNSANGSSISGFASPGQGAMFSILSLNLDAMPVSSSGNTRSEKKTNIGAIVGGVIAGVAVIGLGIFAFFFWKRRQNKKRAGSYTPGESGWGSFSGTKHEVQQHGSSYEPTLYNSYEAHPFDTRPHEIQSHYAPTIDTTVRNADNSSVYLSPSSIAPSLPAPVISTVEPPPQSGKAGMVHLTYSIPPVAQFTPKHGSSASGTSTTDPDQTHLRSEVENLRREMEEMRARSQYEPPPQYT